MEHNLFTPMVGPLNYPHHTKIGKGEISIVTHPDKAINIGDVVYLKGREAENIPRHKVVEVVEQRKARGQHSTSFEPIFQKLKIVKV